LEKILVLGVGPGASEYVLPKTMELAAKCHVLLGGERNLALFRELSPEKVALKGSLDNILEYLKKHYGRKKMGVLVSGDPGLFSMLGVLRRHFPEEALEVVPGISALQYFCACLQLSWHDALILSLHGREEQELASLVRGSSKVIIFTDSRWTPASVCDRLVEEGLRNRKVFVGERLSYPEEKILTGGLEDFREKEVSNPNLMAIISESGEDR